MDEIMFQGLITRIANSATHKMTKITVEIPQEGGLEFIRQFGWATEAAPIPVVLYKVQQQPTEKLSEELQPYSTTQTVTRSDAARPSPSLVRRAALLCKDPLFWTYIVPHVGPEPNEEEAAEFVRQHCGNIRSRANILPGTHAGNAFEALERHFALWRDAPKYEDA